LRSGFELPAAVQMDLWLRYVDSVSAGRTIPGFETNIPDYLTLDARLAWQPHPSLDLAVVGQNLLDSMHPEFQQELFPGALVEIPRSIYFKLNWRF
jgi:iron complex outermembrane receptor protein